MVLSKIATLSTFLASASLVAGHGFVSSILANGQKYVYIVSAKAVLNILTDHLIQLYRLYRQFLPLHERSPRERRLGHDRY
jgi:hypothetical protein